MTDREMLQAIVGNHWGSCEELALPNILVAVRAHLAGDRQTDAYVASVNEGATPRPHGSLPPKRVHFDPFLEDGVNCKWGKS